MDKPIKRNDVFKGTLENAFQTYINSDEQKLAGEFWHCEALATAVGNAERAIKSIAVLRKHIPQQFQPLIRFAQPKIVWHLNVQNGLTATQLNILLDDLLLRIAKDIGYAPRLKVSVQPSELRWKKSGFPLEIKQTKKFVTPSEEEAQKIIAEFLNKR